jgi:ornithine cyclodeaminase
MSVLILNHDDVHAALEPEECERAMTAVLSAHARGEAYFPLRSMMWPPGAPGLMGLMPAYSGGTGDGDPGVFALKVICLMRDNPARGLDAHQGVVTLFDHDTGLPTAVMNASAITEIRTAAVTAAATRALARDDATVLAILGAGVQARSHLRAFRGMRDWQESRVYAPTAEHAQAVADGEPGVTVSPSAADAVHGADVVVVATSATEPVLEHAWLSPGTHVNAVGASTPNNREIQVETVAASALYCDSRESLRNEAGEFILAIKQGAIGGDDHVRGELGELFTGRAPGRADDDELTLFRSLGVGIEDLAAAQVAVVRARERGIGTEVDL